MENDAHTNFLRVLNKLFPTLDKLCIVTNCFPPCPQDTAIHLGGIYAKYVQLAEALDGRKQAFFVISLYYLNPSRAQDATQVYRVGTYRPYSVTRRKLLYPFWEFFNPAIFAKCVRVLRREKPGVVLIGDTGQMSLGPLLASKILGIPVIIEHDWICPTYPRGSSCDVVCRIIGCGECLDELTSDKQSKMVKRVFGLFSAFMYVIKKRIWNKCLVFAESDYFYRLYVMSGIDPKVIRKVPPSPSVDTQTPLDVAFEKTLHRWVGHSKVLVYVGRLSREKGMELLLESYGMVKEKMGSVKLIIAGDGLLRDFVLRESSQDADILFLGWLDKPKLKCVYSIADMVAIPSIRPEAYPHVALEALAFDKKVVAFKIGGVVEMSAQNPGIVLVDQLTVEAYAGKIIENMS